MDFGLPFCFNQFVSEVFSWNEQFLRFSNLAVSEFAVYAVWLVFFVLLFKFLTYFSTDCFVVEEYERFSRFIASQECLRSVVVTYVVLSLF